MTSNEKGWHYLVAKLLPALLRGKTSKHDGNFCCLNYLSSFTTENCENVKIKIFSNLVMTLKY